MRFTAVWKGAIDNNWENPGNWSCGTVPNQYTDVVINSGNVVVSSTVTVRTLTLQMGVVFTVGTGGNVTVVY